MTEQENNDRTKLLLKDESRSRYVLWAAGGVLAALVAGAWYWYQGTQNTNAVKYVTTLSILEDYLLGFPGPILAVSHDRFFLDKLAESIFEVRGDGEIHRFTGNWTDWQAKRRAEEALSPKAEKPKPAAERPRERKLKFTFKEQREFETIDADLAELEAQITACQTEQESCGSDYVKLQELQARQAELEAALEEKTERWVYLNELKEQIDAQNG